MNGLIDDDMLKFDVSKLVGSYWSVLIFLSPYKF